MSISLVTNIYLLDEMKILILIETFNSQKPLNLLNIHSGFYVNSGHLPFSGGLIKLIHFLGCKSRGTRDSRSNREVWPWTTKWSRAKANSFAKRTKWSLQTPSSNNTRYNSTHGHDQMLNTKIRLIIFLAVKMDKFYTVSKNKIWKCLVALIMCSLLQIQA